MEFSAICYLQDIHASTLAILRVSVKKIEMFERIFQVVRDYWEYYNTK